MMNQIKKIMHSEAIRYIIVGGFTTLVNLVVFTVLCELFKMNVNISNIISIITAILFAYVTNKIFVFQSHCSSWKELYYEFSKFTGARILTMVLEVGGVYVLFSVMGYNEIISKIVTQFFVLIGNFFISKFLVFVNEEDK